MSGTQHHAPSCLRRAVRSHLATLPFYVCLVLGAPGFGAAQAPPQPPLRIGQTALAQIRVLLEEKKSRTPAQAKMDSHLIFALMKQRQDGRLKALPDLRILTAGADGKVLVDVKAVALAGMKTIVRELRALGADIAGASFRYRSVRARVPLGATETLAGMPEVRQVGLALPALPSIDSEGDATHRAAEARNFFGVNGAGVKICALSTGVDSLPALQANGLLPAVDVLPNQAGQGDEGTAMLEILHDLAPGAALGFATAQNGEAQFAQNILDLRNVSKCDILVDDIIFPDESPFQDNDPAQAVTTVTAAGALYFSSAGNEGNLDAGTSGNWEGDFKPNGNLDPVLGAGAGTTHDFGDGGQSDLVNADSNFVSLLWTDPFGQSGNDYDLYILDGGLTTVTDASTNTQNGTQDPFEISNFPVASGSRVVVTQFLGANRMLHVEAFRGLLNLATSGCTHGHSAVAAAFSTAAVPAAIAFGPGSPTGPFPGPFTAAQLTEPFTCDGPRRIYFDNGGNLLPGAAAGDFSATGGVVRQKPDLTAADGVHTDVNGFQFFFGTSAAAPHAAAIAGLLKSALPALSTSQIRSDLATSAIDIQAPGTDRDTGAGIVMAYQALQKAGAAPRATLELGTVTPSRLAGKRYPGAAGAAGAGGAAAATGAAAASARPIKSGAPGIQTGEDWAVSISLNNAGGATATALSAVLTTSTPGVRIIQGTTAYPDLAPGASAANTSQLSFTSLAADCGTVIEFTLTVALQGGNSPQSFNFTLQTGTPGAPVTFSFTGPPVPIPDATIDPNSGAVINGMAAAPLAVSGLSGRVMSLQASLDGTLCTTAAAATTVGIDHTFINDLSIDVVAPDGSLVTVINQIDFDGHNFCQVLLDDASAGPSIETANSSQAPFTGSWRPNAPLAAFLGVAPDGIWKLQATDHAPQDSGSIRAFSLIITPAVCNAVAATARVTATKSVSGPAPEGGTVTYTVVLTNSGTGAQPDNPGHEFTDTLPPQLTLLSASATSGTITTAGNTVAWDGGILGGDSVTITISARVNAGTLGQVVSNQGSVSFDPGRTGSNASSTLTGDPKRSTPLAPTTFVVSLTNIAAIPALSELGLAALALALLACAIVLLRRSGSRSPR